MLKSDAIPPSPLPDKALTPIGEKSRYRLRGAAGEGTSSCASRRGSTMRQVWRGWLAQSNHDLRQMPLFKAVRTLLNVNQKGGIDCVSCAWPESDHDQHIAEFCENGAKAISRRRRARASTPAFFFAKYLVAELSKQSDYWLGQLGRITHPMVLRSGAEHYEPIPWEEAFTLLAERARQSVVARRGRLLHLGSNVERGGVLSINFSCGASAPTACPTAPTCATRAPASRSMPRWESAKARSPSTISTRPRSSSFSVRTPAPTTLECLRRSRRPSRHGAKDHRHQPFSCLPRQGFSLQEPQVVRGVLLGGTPLAAYLRASSHRQGSPAF